MVVRKKKTTRSKQLGERTHGHGDTKNRRGAGNRGGHGRAGSHKHKFSKYYMTFGIKVTLKAKPKGKALNVGQITAHLDDWKKKGKIVEEDGMLVIDGDVLGISTLLGSGDVNGEWLVKNVRVSEKARQKIEAAEGEIDEGFESDEGEAKAADPTAGEGR